MSAACDQSAVRTEVESANCLLTYLFFVETCSDSTTEVFNNNNNNNNNERDPVPLSTAQCDLAEI